MSNSFDPDSYHHRAQKWARILGQMPGVKGIFLSGSLARGDGNADSDIDFFVVTSPGQIWTARFFIFLILKLCNRLAKPENHAGNICPNHFVTTDSLEIREQDAYAAEMFSCNVPLYDSGGVWEMFVQANEGWIERFEYSFSQIRKKKEERRENEVSASFCAGAGVSEHKFKNLSTWSFVFKKNKCLDHMVLSSNNSKHAHICSGSGENTTPPQSLNSHLNSGPPSGGGRNTAPLKKGEASNTFEEQEAEGFINTSPLAGGIKGGSSNNKNSKIPDHASFHSAVRDDIKLLKLNPRTILERLLRHVQIKKIKSNPDYQTPGACIILDDDELRFHPVRKNRGIN